MHRTAASIQLGWSPPVCHSRAATAASVCRCAHAEEPLCVQGCPTDADVDLVAAQLDARAALRNSSMPFKSPAGAQPPCSPHPVLCLQFFQYSGPFLLVPCVCYVCAAVLYINTTYLPGPTPLIPAPLSLLTPPPSLPHPSLHHTCTVAAQREPCSLGVPTRLNACRPARLPLWGLDVQLPKAAGLRVHSVRLPLQMRRSRRSHTSSHTTPATWTRPATASSHLLVPPQKQRTSLGGTLRKPPAPFPGEQCFLQNRRTLHPSHAVLLKPLPPSVGSDSHQCCIVLVAAPLCARAGRVRFQAHAPTSPSNCLAATAVLGAGDVRRC